MKMNIMFPEKFSLHRFIHAVFLLCVLFFSSFVSAGSLTASVDRDTVGIKETLTLTVSVDGQTKDAPDFSALKHDFDVLSSQRSSSIQVVNGNTESSTDWNLTLAPKHTGTLLIPSFNVDNAVSDAIEIKVTQQSQTQSDSDEQVKTSTEINKSSVFVQEQILFKIKLITEVNLSQAELEPLELKNALVVNMEPKQYQININGKPHLVVENTYAIFPQESRDIVIPSLAYNVVVNNPRSVWGDPFGRSRNNVLRLRTDEQHINVKPIPAQNTGKVWQPASQLSLSETWSSSLDHLKIGEPVTRTIMINADSLTGGQIAPITQDNIDGLTFYPDQPQTKDNKNSNGVQGTRIETIAIVPNHGGDFTLPAINVDWWNTATQQMETATLPEKKIHVLGEVAPTTVLPTPQNLSQNANQENTVQNNNTTPATVIQKENSIPWWIWAIIALCTILTLGLLSYVLSLKKHLYTLQHEKDERERGIQENEKHTWDSLRKSAASKNIPAFRKAVLSWANLQWPEQKINTLEEIAKLANNEALTAALKQLDEALYSNHASADWDAVDLLKLLGEFRKPKQFDEELLGLKPLYAD